MSLNTEHHEDDGDSIRCLHQELSPQLVRIAWAMLRDWELAADAVQEAFLLLASQESPIAPEHVRGWLVKTVQYCAANLRRSRTRQTKHTELASRICEQTEQYSLDTAGPLEKHEDIDRLRLAIRQLPTDQQQIVERRIRNEQTYAEIAASLDLPLGTVLSRMRLAIEKLRRALSD